MLGGGLTIKTGASVPPAWWFPLTTAWPGLGDDAVSPTSRSSPGSLLRPAFLTKLGSNSLGQKISLLKARQEFN